MINNFTKVVLCALAFTFLNNVSPVFAQDNGNIIGTVKDNADSAPIENATLILFLKGSGNNLKPVDTTTTNSSGEYAFLQHEAPARFFLGVSAIGYAAYTEKSINLQPDDTLVIDIDLQKISNENTGVITGMVIDNSDSTPIADALIVLYHSQSGGGLYIKIADTKTNTDGGYAFYQVPQGSNYRIDASADNYINGSETRITVAAQDTIKVNFLLRKETTSVSTYDNTSVSRQTIKVVHGHLVYNLNSSDKAVLTVYSAAGKIIVRKELNEGYNAVVLPGTIGNQVVFVSIKCGAETTHHRVFLP